MNELKSLIILFKAYASVEAKVRKSLEGTDLNLNEFMALEALYHKGNLTTQSLIDLVLIPNSSMTYVLDILNKKEFIIRAKDEKDRRVQIIQITENGKNVFEDVYAKHYKVMRELFDVLDEAEEEKLQDMLKLLGKTAQGDK